MQTKILLSLIVLCLSAAAMAQPAVAKTTPGETRHSSKETSFTLTVVPDKTAAAFGLYIDNPEQKKIELQISHKLNGVVVDTTITGLQYNRRYNFEMADDGSYRITLVCGKQKISKTVAVNTVTARNIIMID